MPRDVVGRLQRAAAAWDAAERVVLGTLAAGMVILAATQIVLRNFFRTGLPWAEPLLNQSLLWLTMFGALAATGQRKHITMDLASHVLPPRAAAAVRAATNLFAAALCAALTKAGWHYVAVQREMDPGGLLGVPQWVFPAVIPLVFALLAWRFALQTVVAAAGVRRPRSPSAAEAPPAPAAGSGGEAAP